MKREERKRTRGFRTETLSVSRRWVAAAAAVNRDQNTIHLLAEADITEPRRLIALHRDRTGERLSLTAYVAACLARTIADFPRFNAFRKGRRLILLDEVTVNVLFEREIDGERVPEPVGIHAANEKAYREIHDELRAHQQRAASHVGDSAGLRWLGVLPAVLFKVFVRVAARSVSMNKRYGVIGLTAIGMFGKGAMWPVPLTHATVTVAVGSIVTRPVLREGRIEDREFLCLTLSFNHDLIDGAPAARFVRGFVEALSSGRALREVVEGDSFESPSPPEEVAQQEEEA